MANTLPLALVTGGSRGLGWHLVEGLLARDYGVAYISRAPAAAPFSRPALHLAGDLERPEAVLPGLRACLERSGPPAVFIHNAGMSPDAPADRQTAAEWDRGMAVNFRSLAVVWEEVEPRLGADASAALVGSRQARTGGRGLTAYAAAKGLLIDFMHIWAPVLGARSIRLNVLHPGYLDTALTRPSQPRSRQRAEAASALRAIGEIGIVSNWMLEQILTPGLTGQVLEYDSRILRS